MNQEDIRRELFDLQDIKYWDFQAKLIPGIDTEKMIGVRTPALRKLAKRLYREREISGFLDSLPHEYFGKLPHHRGRKAIPEVDEDSKEAGSIR